MPFQLLLHACPRIVAVVVSKASRFSFFHFQVPEPLLLNPLFACFAACALRLPVWAVVTDFTLHHHTTFIDFLYSSKLSGKDCIC
jgi:hypothetical protein